MDKKQGMGYAYSYMRHFSLFTILLFILFSCELPSPYYDDIINKNLISDATLDQWYHNDNPTIVGESLTEPYMLYQQVSPNGGYGGGAEYRLELKNLMPDGDFESGSLDAGWDLSNVTPNPLLTSTAPKAIEGTSLTYDFDANNYFSFDLNSISDTALLNTKYRIHFTLRTKGTYLFDFNDGTTSFLTDPNQSWSGVYANYTTISFPTPNVVSIINHPSNDLGYFSVGTPDDSVDVLPGQVGSIDNFSVVRAEGSYGIAYQIDEPIASDGTELLPGTYRFSVYVKNEADSDVTPTTPNRYKSGYVTLKSKGPTSSFKTEEASDIFVASPDWSDWTKISVSLSDLRPGAGDLPITLTVLPYNNDDRYSGSIIVSAPQLEFIP